MLWFKSVALMVLVFQSVFCLAIDVDGDGIDDRIEVSSTARFTEIKTQISSMGKQIETYSVEPFDPCSPVFVDFQKYAGTLVLDGSCSGRDGQIFVEIYKWGAQNKKWILAKVVGGERGATNKNGLPALTIDRVECCLALGSDTHSRKYLSTENSKSNIRSEILNIYINLADTQQRTKMLGELDYYTLLEFANSLEKENVQQLNDVGYYLWKDGFGDKALLLMSAIVAKFPNRTVANLNIADVLWDLERVDEAKGYYRKYLERMTIEKKQARIPRRVFERTE